ncbi:uncharacterized protein LOC109833445 [Asparagus officinalis]|uniref:uncharacterized protein LOC109833445 n=1 Tax=Asparagus officinalis TaxID=4686 RepID=UPI00098E2B8F|nr:uncharacterized protein LOC109833445 [Asparagus officinalis]
MAYVPKGKPDNYYSHRRGLGYVSSSDDECCWQVIDQIANKVKKVQVSVTFCWIALQEIQAMSKNINRRLFEANPSQDQSTEEEPQSSGEMSGEGEEEPTHMPLYADPPVILRAYIPGIERGPLPACAEGYRLKQTEKYMLAKKRLDEWAPQIEEILSDANNEIRQRFGEKLYQKKGRQGSDFKKKLPPDEE